MTRIVHERDVEPTAASKGTSVRTIFDASNGSETLRHSLIELGADHVYVRDAGDCEEVLFVLSGQGSLRLNGFTYLLEPETGVHVAPGERYELRSDDCAALKLASTLVADPEAPSPDAGARRVVVRLTDEPTQAATSDREFRIICDNSTGCASVTQFVGFIPPGRTPDHFHEYDEVIYVLRG